MTQKLLVIGLIWPEPTTTAAGVRMLQLLELFLEEGFTITFASTASHGEYSFDLENWQITTENIKLNDASFDTLIQKLQPDIVLFDRFISEEQFGWRVAESCPKALRLLDTEDLHSLRESRKVSQNDEQQCITELLNASLTKREIASIYRSDLTLVISSFEYKLLHNIFKIPEKLLFYIPFLTKVTDLAKSDSYPTFEARKNYMCIGNFNHAPNVDSIHFIKNEIWPEIHQLLPEAKIHIYGAYMPNPIKNLHDPATNFIIKGWISSSKHAFINSRVCLAPLQYGAGQKGKLFESMKYGTPNVTSSMGAESMGNEHNWNGFICDEKTAFVQAAIRLYTQKKVWDSKQQKGYQLIAANFDKEMFQNLFIKAIKDLCSTLDAHRVSNFIGGMLMQQTTYATKYLSRWIELKNKLN